MVVSTAACAASHESGAVHAEHSRLRHDAAFLVPVNGQVRYARRRDGQSAGHAKVRQLDMRELDIQPGEEALDGVDHGFDLVLRGFNGRCDGGLDPVPHGGGRGFDSVENRGHSAFHSIKGRAHLALDAVNHGADRGFYSVPERRDKSLDRIEDRGHHALDGFQGGGHLSVMFNVMR